MEYSVFLHKKVGEHRMKKVLLLGGSAQQIIAIETAKQLGYFTVLCDYLADNPGQYYADKFYLVSTTDKEAVLEVAEIEKIDGILAYASDPAAPTAAYVAEKLGLPTNPYTAVDTLCNKDKFREFLKHNGFNTPVAQGFENKEDALKNLELFKLPVIIKPVDSSGSKGATVLYNWDNASDAIDFAFTFSRVHRIIIEEYIEMKHKYLVGGDVFVLDGQIVIWGLLNCHRDNNVNPLVPVGKSYPLLLEETDIGRIKTTLQQMVNGLGIKFGSMNVELVIDKQNKVWPIDVGPRAGGNMIPDLLGIIFDVDVVKMAVLAAMGEYISIEPRTKKQFVATHNLHSSQDGNYVDIVFNDILDKHIFRKCFYKKRGDSIEYFDNAAKALGIIFMRFDSQKEMDDILQNVNELYQVVMEE